MAKSPKITIRDLSEYNPDPTNHNKGTVRGLAMHEKSIEEFGAARSMVSDKNGIMLAGNKTQERLFEAGITEVIEIETDGTQAVVVKRTDLDATTERGKRYAIFDNRTSEVGLEWDATQLAADLASGVDLSAFFDSDELIDLLNSITTPDSSDGDPTGAISRAEEWQKVWQCERGQLWQVGRHRLMCGDSYDTAHIALLMDGKQANMLHTDPPYGINIVKPIGNSSAADSGGAKPFGKTGGEKGDLVNGATSGSRRSDKNGLLSTDKVLTIGKHLDTYGKAIIQSNLYPIIEGDDRLFDPSSFLDFAPIVVLWGANYYADQLPIRSCWICWDKREDITRNNFADGELAWTNQNKPTKIFHHLWNGLHKGSQYGEARMHPTEKPVALFTEIGNMFAPQGLWVDLFAGSGAQLVAAENTGSTCFAMEYEPLYCATILNRLSQIGLTPEKVTG